MAYLFYTHYINITGISENDHLQLPVRQDKSNKGQGVLLQSESL